MLPFKRFRTPQGNIVDSVLGPEMRSTGEVMGIDSDFPRAFAKSQDAAYGGLPESGTVFVSVADRDKRAVVLPVLRLSQLGFDIVATEGTAEVLARNGIRATTVRKYFMGQEQNAADPSIVELINAGKIDVVINTPSGRSARADGIEIRTATVAADKPLFTTIAQLGAAVAAFEVKRGDIRVRSLQDYALDRAAREARRVTSFGELLPACARPARPALRRDRPARGAPGGVGSSGFRGRAPASSGCGSSMRRPGRAGIVKPQVAFFERHGAAGYCGPRGCARGGARRGPGRDRRRQTRRHRVDCRRLRGGLAAAGIAAGGGRDDRGRLSGLRLARPGVRPRTSPRQGRVRAGCHLQPGGEREPAGDPRRRSHGRRRSRGGCRLPERGGRCPGRSARSASCSAPPCRSQKSGIDPALLARTPILAPGFGHQGAQIADGPAIFGGLTQNVLVSVSRSILQAGPDGVADSIAAAAREAAAWAS